jgi:TatD DNase family protein
MSETCAKLVDIHLHLQAPPLAGDIEGVMSRAAAAGVEAMVCCGTCEEDWPSVLELTKRFRGVIPCFGLHPWYMENRSKAWFEKLRRLMAEVPSAVGEAGLDRYREGTDYGAQEEVFRAQLALAREFGRPAMVHCLRAWDWLDRVLRDEPPLPAGFLLHAFGGPAAMVRPMAEMGAYFSFGGDVLDEKRRKKREALRAVPPDRLLLETDAPDFLPPEPFRLSFIAGPDGSTANEPANLRGILRGVADLLGEGEGALAGRLWNNARRLLGDLLPGG